MKQSLKTCESLRRAAARWLLHNDISLVCCENNELSEHFTEAFELPELQEELTETLVGENEEITLVFQSCIQLTAKKSVSGRSQAFVILRYVRAHYDDFGNIYKYETLGYNF